MITRKLESSTILVSGGSDAALLFCLYQSCQSALLLPQTVKLFTCFTIIFYINNKEEIKMKKQQSGFTLIELIVVIVILGILAAVAFPKLQSMDIDAKKAVVQGGLAAVQSAAVISFGKNKAASTFANITANTTLDTNIQGLATTETDTTKCDSVVTNATTITANYGGDATTAMTAEIPAGLCQN